MQYPFKELQHINLQECKARKSLVKRLPRDNRVVICQDSRVNLALAKGGSPSKMFNGLLETEAPLILAKNLHISGVHFPTWSLRADAPSRSRKVEPARSPFPQWFLTLKRGHVCCAAAMLDGLQGLPQAYNRWWLFASYLLLLAASGSSSETPCCKSTGWESTGPRTSHNSNPCCQASASDTLGGVVEGASANVLLRGFGPLSFQKFGWLRGSLSGPWDVIRTWDTLEPVQHHPPMPVHVLRALVSCALAWNWSRMAIVMCLAFFGLLRPSESISLRRQDLALPEDHLQVALHPDWPTKNTAQSSSAATCAARRAGGSLVDSDHADRDTYVCAYL